MTKELNKYQPNNVLSTITTQLKDIEQFAETVVKSKAFGNTLSTKEDVISAIVLGHELGINPMTAISMGKRLDTKSIFSVLKGKSMGIDPITAMEHIHTIPTGNGDVSSTDVHIITAQLLKAGVIYNIIEDYTPLYKYRDSNGKYYDKQLVEDNPDIYQIVTPSTKPEDKNNQKHKVFLDSKPYTYRTTILFEREILINGKTKLQKLPISYTLAQATDAGLYRGIDSLGKQVKGRDNWNSHPATMLRNRCISIGGRIIASDYLQGIYENSEVLEFTDADIVVADTDTIENKKEIILNEDNIVDESKDVSNGTDNK